MNPPKCDRNATARAGGGMLPLPAPVNAAAKVFLVQRSCIFLVCFKGFFSVSAEKLEEEYKNKQLVISLATEA